MATSPTRTPRESARPAGPGDIFIRGARQHNLKNVDVRIPRHRLVVITGVRGSGRNSLALDTRFELLAPVVCGRKGSAAAI